MNAASELYSVLHLTGGKVGSIKLWRKSMDESLAFGWDAFMSLRTTFKHPGELKSLLKKVCAELLVDQHSRPAVGNADPQVVIPLNLNRLRSSIVSLCQLLSYVDDALCSTW
jgi:hypothetical protein